MFIRNHAEFTPSEVIINFKKSYRAAIEERNKNITDFDANVIFFKKTAEILESYYEIMKKRVDEISKIADQIADQIEDESIREKRIDQLFKKMKKQMNDEVSYFFYNKKNVDLLATTIEPRIELTIVNFYFNYKINEDIKERHSVWPYEVIDNKSNEENTVYLTTDENNKLKYESKLKCVLQKENSTLSKIDENKKTFGFVFSDKEEMKFYNLNDEQKMAELKQQFNDKLESLDVKVKKRF